MASDSTSVPTPGTSVRGSDTGRPLMAALDLFGRRWALRILWELRNGPLGARALRAECDGMSSSVLYQRLDELTGASLIEKTTDGDYTLTSIGAEVSVALEPLWHWADRWSDAVGEGAT